MSDKNVFAWDPKSTVQGLSLGGMVDGEHLASGLFVIGKPFKEAVSLWQTFEGIQDAKNGHHVIPGFPETVARTLKWIENPYPIPCVSHYPKEKLEALDAINLLGSCLMVCSQRVVDILTTLCPDEFEAFPLAIETSTGISHQFSLLNLTKTIFPDMDKELSIYKKKIYSTVDENSIQRFTRLILQPGCMGSHQLGLMYHDKSTIMIKKPVIDALKKIKIKGLKYIPLEDEVNALYTPNYHPGTNTLKY